ncbi:TRAP transporter large permease subunit [Microvirga tunisiensis]|uniref:TRAP transporter large permease subunit n=1 Tax=Pannonibacter tanglangensis TaxID=2750084 RepID=A0A7X5F744_9HYPH|nr:TRAP transporter large permease subunit [Pannonibacter sp. XCT-53]NBN79689.1 TRAP transporter large permease subunit [Pannonibacter sp. XCT-53]
MELFFLILLIVLMAAALGSGFPVAFALPGSAIISIGLAAGAGYLFAGDVDAYFTHGGPGQWLSAGVTNFRGVYWEADRDTLIAIPLFIFMGIMLQRSKIAEDLLVTMAKLFGPVPGGLGISVVLVGALLAATTGIVGATVVAMGLISLPAMMRNNYSVPLATGTIAASGTLGQIIPPSIVLIILADQLSGGVDQAGNIRQALYRETTGSGQMPSDFAIASTSAGELFLGALIPGLLLVGLYILFILGFALINPKAAPAVPQEGKFDRKFLAEVFVTLVPPLALIVLVLGSIMMGVATVNQAGAVGAIGAMIMAGYRLREGEERGKYTPAILAIIALLGLGVVLSFYDLNIKRITTSDDVIGLTFAGIAVSLLLIASIWSGWRTLKMQNTLREVMMETAKGSCLVFIILIGAAMLTSAFRAFGGEDLVRDFLQGLPGGFWAQFFMVMLVMFILGFFLDFIEIAVVVVPIVAPILLADPSANVTAVWLGVMMGVNLQTSFLTPPFGFALFYLRGVAPATVKTIQIYKGVIAFICLQLIALAIVGLNPILANYLPNRTALLAETAPPPKNPRLQYCLDTYVGERFKAEGPGILAAIETASQLDVSYLPDDLQKEIKSAWTAAGKVIPLMQDIEATKAAVAAAAVDYRPMHSLVRALERDARKIDEQLKELEVIVQRSGPGGIYSEARGAAAKARIEELRAEKAALLAQIPAEWTAKHDAFAKIQDAENKARNLYRRTVDDAGEPLAKVRAVLTGAAPLAAMEPRFNDLKDAILSKDNAAVQAQLELLRTDVTAIEGTAEIRKGINEARKILRTSTPDAQAAIAEIDKSIAALKADLVWRQKGAAELLPQLDAYDKVTGDTIGLRQLPRLPDHVATGLVGCLSQHRDISLNF